MSYADYLKDFLRPLGVYDLDAPINGGALEAEGAALDAVQAFLEELGRESDLTTAEGFGLSAWKGLFGLLPAAGDAAQLRDSLCALLRIGPDGFTLAAIRDTLSGCGLNAAVEETATGVVTVSFPGTTGVPDNFEALKANVEQIMPAHVETRYLFYSLLWRMLEGYGWTFADVAGMAWEELENSV